LISSEADIRGLNITVMGLGLHGGGAASARFFASRGARVTVTDLRSPEILAGSVESLGDLPLRFVLGEHRDEDFSGADLVIKNPAVPPSSPFLKLARAVESDISVFLRLNRRPVLAVTGSKGKSTVTSAMHHALKELYADPRLGGNITISPLSFWEGVSVEDWNRSEDPVVLELSSWQLADLAGKGILHPRVSVITNILKDHQDKYGGMEGYVRDKSAIYREQYPDQYTLCNHNDPYGPVFYNETPARPFWFSAYPLPACREGAFLENRRGWLRRNETAVEILPETLELPGAHNRLNLLIAAAALCLAGEPAEKVGPALAKFAGIGHRLEKVREWEGIRFYNDSAATIPDAVAAALESFDDPVFLITGGTDKNLDFSPLEGAASRPAEIFLLAGTAEEKYRALLKKAGRDPGPALDSLAKAFGEAVRAARLSAGKGEKPVVLLSPGCASFGMFLNEFDRGRQFRDLVKEL